MTTLISFQPEALRRIVRHNGIAENAAGTRCFHRHIGHGRLSQHDAPHKWYFDPVATAYFPFSTFNLFPKILILDEYFH